MPSACLYCGGVKVVCIGIKHTDEREGNEYEKVY